MAFDIRTLAVPTAGFAAFINLYSPQALLPRLAHDFDVSAGEISALITAATAAIALTAPFTGALADVLGRKRLITAAMFAMVVPTLCITLASSVPQLVFWRFIQGLLVPPIFTVSLAYIGEEWPPGEITRIAGLYTAGSSFGGFCGRFIPGLVTDLAGWRSAFIANALLTLAAAIFVAFALPRERRFVRSAGLLASSRQMLAHLRDPRLLPIFAVGFGVLFNFTAVFTYVNFHLAAPPYRFSPTMLGAIFVTYLAGSLLVPWIGRGVSLFGRRRFVLGIVALWVAGALLLLAPPVSIIITGLALCAACGLLCQAVSTSYIITVVQEGRSSAVGLYASIFYIGGSAGAFLTGFAWSAAGWPGCVAAIVAMQMIVAAIVAIAWER
jgi:MFS transporter, YNFM family, putative membrane transport protein